eukprot:348916_1
METTQDEIFTPGLISDMVAMFHRSHHQIVIEQNCGEKIVCFVLTIYLDGNRVWSSDYDITNVDTSINQEVYDFNDIPPHIFGDKVEVVNPTTAKALSFEKVQVFGLAKETYNVARKKETEQSSPYNTNSLNQVHRIL